MKISLPELADYIDLETDAIEGGTEALRANIDAWREKAQAQAKLQVEQQENYVGLTRAQQQYTTAQENFNKTQRDLQEIHRKMVAEGSTKELRDEYGRLRSDQQDYLEQMNYAEEAMHNYQQAIDAGADALSDMQDNVELARN